MIEREAGGMSWAETVALRNELRLERERADKAEAAWHAAEAKLAALKTKPGPPKRDTCKRGHPMTGDNVIERAPPRGRTCRTCVLASYKDRASLMHCGNCGADPGHCCRDDDDQPARMCPGRPSFSPFVCVGCGAKLSAAGRRTKSQRACCGKKSCYLAAKREWARADRAKKKEVTT